MSILQQLTPNLWCNSSEVFTYHSGLFVSNGQAVVMDPGLSEPEINTLAQAVRAQNWTIQAVILTHGHWDHVLGTEAFPNARIITQNMYLTSPRNDPAGIARIVEKTPDLKRTVPFKMPQPDQTFGEQMTLTVGELTLELSHTPGHAPDHLFVLEQGSGTVWTADMLSDMEIPYVIDNLAAYVCTMEKIDGDDYQFLAPCHGTATGDAQEIRARIENDRRYISELGERVGNAVKAGKSLEETKAACADIPYRQSVDENRGAHRRNVESAYVELGGPVDPETVGWRKAWYEFTS